MVTWGLRVGVSNTYIGWSIIVSTMHPSYSSNSRLGFFVFEFLGRNSNLKIFAFKARCLVLFLDQSKTSGGTRRYLGFEEPHPST